MVREGATGHGWQVRMLKPLGYHLVWYGAGNAIYVHRSVSTRLGRCDAEVHTRNKGALGVLN